MCKSETSVCAFASKNIIKWKNQKEKRIYVVIVCGGTTDKAKAQEQHGANAGQQITQVGNSWSKGLSKQPLDLRLSSGRGAMLHL